MENNNYITRELYEVNQIELRENVQKIISASESRCEKMIAEIRAETQQIRANNLRAGVLLSGTMLFLAGMLFILAVCNSFKS